MAEEGEGVCIEIPDNSNGSGGFTAGFTAGLTVDFIAWLMEKLEHWIVDCERTNSQWMQVDKKYCDDVLSWVLVLTLLQMLVLTSAVTASAASAASGSAVSAVSAALLEMDLVTIWDTTVNKVTESLATSRFSFLLKWSFEYAAADVKNFILRVSNTRHLGARNAMRELIMDLGLTRLLTTGGAGAAGATVTYKWIVRPLFKVFCLLPVHKLLRIRHKYFRLPNCQNQVEKNPNAAYYAAYRESEDGPLILLGQWTEQQQGQSSNEVKVDKIMRKGKYMSANTVPAPQDQCELTNEQTNVLQQAASDFPHAYTKDLRIRFGDKIYAPVSDEDTPDVCQGLDPRVVWPAQKAVAALERGRKRGSSYNHEDTAAQRARVR